jgi:hypothetical protein
MPNLNVNILGRDGNTRAKVTGQEELLVSVGSISPVADLATETTLKSVENLSSLILTAIQAGTEYEAALVIDASDVTWLEIRVYNPDSGTFDSPVYYLAGSNTPGTPALPITYINPNTYLAQIVSNTTGLATETTLLSINGTLSSIDAWLGPENRTPNLIRPSGIFGNTPVGTYSVSFASVGTANATVGGMILKPGETVNFDGGAVNNTVGVIAYDTTLAGAELIITYLI